MTRSAAVPLVQRWGVRALVRPSLSRWLPWLGIATLALWTLKPPFWGSDGFTDWYAARQLLLGERVYHAAETNVGLGYFFYPPPVAQLLAPTAWLPFPVWAIAWSALQFLALRWLAGSRWLAASLLLVPVVPLELQMGNVHLFLAVFLALGLSRWSGWLGLLPMTKLLPVSWLVRPSVAPVIVGGAILAGSVAISPQAWQEWLPVVTGMAGGTGQNTIPVPWAVRLVLAAALLLVARRVAPGPSACLLVTATWLTIPTMWINSAVILLAALRIPQSRAWLEELVVGERRAAREGSPARGGRDARDARDAPGAAVLA